MSRLRRLRCQQSGFTLVELLIAMTIGAMIIGALAAALMLALQTTFGLGASASVTKQQDAQLVAVQLDADAGVQALTSTFAQDIASVNRSSDVSPGAGLPGSCAAPVSDPSLAPGSDTALVRLETSADSNDDPHIIVYRYSVDAKQRYGQIVRYDCVAGSTSVSMVVRGVSSVTPPSVTTNGDLVTLQVETATGRDYQLPGQLRLNLDAPTPTPTPTETTPPLLQPVTSLLLEDTNANGKVDQITAAFGSLTLDSTACKTGWSVAGASGGATLASVAISGSAATLTLTEGAVDTSVGTTLVTFVPASGCQVAPFALQPTDKASPVVMAVSDTDGATDGQMETGDTLSVTFSEPIKGTSVAGDSGLISIANTDTGNQQTDDTLTVDWPSSSPTTWLFKNQDLGASQSYVQKGKQATCAATIARSGGNPNKLVVTVGTCSASDSKKLKQSSGGSFNLTPDSTITDSAGNGAIANATPQPGSMRLF